VTTGAASDIQQATGIARRYVTQWGLSDAIGPILVGVIDHGGERRRFPGAGGAGDQDEALLQHRELFQHHGKWGVHFLEVLE